jgi:hypothetical protein
LEKKVAGVLGRVKRFGKGLKIKKPSIAGRLLMNMATTYSPGWNTSTIGHKGLIRLRGSVQEDLNINPP